MSSSDIERRYRLAADAYHANAVYYVPPNVAKARAFLIACRQLLEVKPSIAAKGSENFEFDPTVLERRLERVEKWCQANDSAMRGSRYRHFSFEEYR